MGSDDTALAAFAQLGALRLNAQRCLISLFGREHEYVLAEATRTLSLQSDAVHNSGDALWIGMRSFSRKEGFSNMILGDWRTAKGDRTNPSQSDYYHTDNKSAHSLVISDLRQHSGAYSEIYQKFNTQFRFLCSVPIRSHRGNIIGAYTIIDGTPRYGVSEIDLVFMEDMAETIMSHLDAKRAATQKQGAERLIKGLSLLSSGGSSLREWWLEGHDLAKQRKRKQERLGPEDTGDQRAQRADNEFGETYHARRLIARLGSRRHSRAPSHENIRTEGPDKTTKQVDFADHGSTQPTSEDNKHSSSNPKVAPSNPEPEPDEPSPHSTAHRAGFNLAVATSETFARASNLAREALNVEGVLFLEADFADAGKESRRRLNNNSDHSSASSESDPTSAGEPDREIMQKANESRLEYRKRQRRARDGPSSEISCVPLGYSTRTGSSLRSFTPPKKHLTLPQSRLEKLLRRYPRGKVFNIQENGTLYPSSTSGGEENESTGLSEVTQTSGNGSLGPRFAKKQRELGALVKILDGARSIAFLPLWDVSRCPLVAPLMILINDRLIAKDGVLGALSGARFLANSSTVTMRHISRHLATV